MASDGFTEVVWQFPPVHTSTKCSTDIGTVQLELDVVSLVDHSQQLVSEPKTVLAGVMLEISVVL